jgi:uncharacterized protein YbgA (DUF1722 family)/uncharacterized protein YbbK (DUF523 family)
MPSRVRLGISACLLGEKVRYDGGHKRDRFLTDVLGRHVEWVPVCPEVEIGMGTPREPIQLVQGAGGIRLLGVTSELDHAEAMRRFARKKLDELIEQGIRGYVLKKDSPSCGMDRVKLYDEQGVSRRQGVGVFAEALMRRLPHLPIADEARLSDARLRENFIERIFAYCRLRALFDRRWSVGHLVRFHTAHKLMLLAHQPRAYGELGQLVAHAKSLPRSRVRARYEAAFMEALAKIATPRRHRNVLLHMLGYFKRLLNEASRHELLTSIEDHSRGLVPLSVPLALFRHHVRQHGVEYLAGQVYLEPHPAELMDL